MAQSLNDRNSRPPAEEVGSQQDRTAQGPAGLSYKMWGALAVFSAGLLLVEVNIEAARHFKRWDVSAQQNYSLSAPTKALLSGLEQPLTITTLLGAGAQARLELKYLVEAYRSASPMIRVAQIDPDRQPAEYLAKVQTLESLQQSEAGPAGEPAVIIEQGPRRWLIQATQLNSSDDEGRIISTVEQSLSEGIAHVLEGEKDRICFVTGHGEASIDDAAPEGLLELGRVLRRSNVEAERVPMDVPDPIEALRGCTALAVVGPTRPIQKEHAEALLRAHRAGMGLLLFVDPLVSKDATIEASGLEELARESGVIMRGAFVLEGAPQLRLPTGLGEAFFASPTTHAITRGLSSDSARLDSRVLLVAAQPLRPVPGMGAQALLHSSDEAIALSDLQRRLSDEDWVAPFDLALAYESTGETKRRRAVTVGTSNLLTNAAQRDPAQLGNRIFAENAFAWVLSRKSLVSVPPKQASPAGLNLSEESLSSLLRYVLIYLPLGALALAAWILLRRYRAEQEARREQKG